jgi:salicylate hydroxylase
MSIQGRNVLVAGGGIAGMAASLLLGNAGASVTMIERVAEPEAAGAGLLLQPNGLAVLSALGLDGKLEHGSRQLTDGLALRDARGPC